MKEFKINEYLTLKLENNETTIYVKDERFVQCKFLLLEVPVNKITSLDDIDSIDEVAERLDNALEPLRGKINDKIPLETEFWGHCSNLQVWYEHDYDTRLLHSNLSFSLLKKLTEVEDSLAKKVFKDEIAKRIASEYLPVITYLIEEGYLDYFNEEEVKTLFQGCEFIEHKKKKIPVIQNILCLRGKKIKNLSEIIGLNKLSSIQSLNLGKNELTSLSEDIGNLSSLKTLNLQYNELKSLSESIGDLRSLQSLNLAVNLLTSLPRSFGNLTSLKNLDICYNQLNLFPKVLLNIISLQTLDLNGIELRSLPESISNLINLQTLHLEGNHLTSLPKSLGDLSSLKTLKLGFNNLTSLPKSLGNLTSLKTLKLSYNNLISLPNSISNLTSLKTLTLQSNNLVKIPEEIIYLPSLKNLYIGDNPLDLRKNSYTNQIIEQLRRNGIYVCLEKESIFVID